MLVYDKSPTIRKQEAQGLSALLDKMENNDHMKLDNTEV